MPAKNILLVEGASDQKFFKQLLSGLSNTPEIEPKIPRDVDAQIYRNGLQPLYRQLQLQLDLLIRGQVNKLAVIVDADHTAQAGNGFANRREQLIGLLAEKDFVITLQPQAAAVGEIFKHPSGAEVGVWIMPDHQSDGMIEDLFIGLIKPEHAPLLQQATEVIGNLGEYKAFAPHHESKARLSTWLAWQKEPGISPSYAYYKDLFDKENVRLVALTDWLKRVFD